MEPITLTSDKFELEKRSRDIHAITDVQQLQNLTKDLLLAWRQEIARSRAAVTSSRLTCNSEINSAGQTPTTLQRRSKASVSLVMT